MTEWTWEDFGPGKSGEQFRLLAERLAIWGYYPKNATVAYPLKHYVQQFQLQVMKLHGTYPGGPADGWVGPKTWARLMEDPIVSPQYSISTRLWKWTSPVWDDDSPLEIYPIKDDFEMNPWFVRTPSGSIILSANAGGAHTENSLKARSEFREMNPDGSRSSWDSEDGDLHVLEGLLRIIALPPKVPSAVFGQYHDPKDDLFMLNVVANKDRRYATIKLLQSLGPGKGSIPHLLDSSHRLGDPIKYRMEMGHGGFKCIYNDTITKEFEGEWEDVYRKAGIYLQTDVSKGEHPDAVGSLEYLGLKIFDV